MQSARDHGVSWPVVAAAFTAHAAAVLPGQAAAGRGAGHRRGPPRAARSGSSTRSPAPWQTTVDRWHVGFCDLSGGQGLLGQVEGRTAQVVADWLPRARSRGASRSGTWRSTCARCSSPRSAQALPHATLVVDHFHVVQLANATVTEVRRRITIQLRGRRGRKGNREWELRNRLTRSAARMRGEHVDRARRRTRGPCPRRIGVPILAAWNAKEDLLDLLALARTHPDREDDRRPAVPVLPRCADSGLPELERLASTIADLVAGDPGVPPHRHHQRRLRRHQPRHQDRRPRRLRLPQPRQPATTHPLRHHPASPRTPQPRLTSKSRDQREPICSLELQR